VAVGPGDQPLALPTFATADGTLVPINRVAGQKRCYSEKHRRHGVNIQVLAEPAERFTLASRR
jgi:hypothetical protein